MNINIHWLSTIANFIIFILSITIASICVYLYTIYNNDILMASIISGYLLGLWLIASSVIRNYFKLKNTFDILLKLFQLIMAILLVVKLVSNSITLPEPWEVVISVLYMIQLFIIGMSLICLIVITAIVQAHINDTSRSRSDTKENDTDLNYMNIVNNTHDNNIPSSLSKIDIESEAATMISNSKANNILSLKSSSSNEDNWMNTNISGSLPKGPFSKKGPSYFKSMPNFHTHIDPPLLVKGEAFDSTDTIQAIDPIDPTMETKYDGDIRDSNLHQHKRKSQSKHMSTILPIDDKSKETLIHSNSDTIVPDHNYVKRSKSTSSIIDNKRHQKWKSMNDEMVFLESINESLLPSVLKKGESHIMELKRQQESASDSELPKGYRPYQHDYLLSNSEENLPHISEFDESNNYDSLDQSQFKDFDQTVNLAEYNNSLNDLENIPQLINTNWIKQKPSMNHISLNDWKENMNNYKVARSRSGANLNVPGITRLVSDHHLTNSTVPIINDDNLLPPLENRADNIDHLSDVQSFEGMSFNHLNRSFSAPSLHTFRNVSNSSKEESKPSISELPDNNLNQTQSSMVIERTPSPVMEDMQASSKSSPIKKIFHQSPKKFFKKKSVDFDLGDKYCQLLQTHENGHHHNTSSISFQLSLSSSKSGSPKKSSSNSLSPKKSIKSFLPKKTSPPASQPPPPKPIYIHKPHVKEQLFQEDNNWDGDTTKSSNNSRISSLPSAVIGEYDREKWRTLKALDINEL